MLWMFSLSHEEGHAVADFEEGIAELIMSREPSPRREQPFSFLSSFLFFRYDELSRPSYNSVEPRRRGANCMYRVLPSKPESRFCHNSTDIVESCETHIPPCPETTTTGSTLLLEKKR